MFDKDDKIIISSRNCCGWQKDLIRIRHVLDHSKQRHQKKKLKLEGGPNIPFLYPIGGL
jgi:hypothetical protein